MVKISLQLYKVQDQIYLLDFHSLEGHPFRFMSLCSKVRKVIGPLASANPLVPLISVALLLHFR